MLVRVSSLLLAACVTLIPQTSLAQAATVDQVLAALAEVVKDRAKQVAAEAIAAQIKKQICTHQAIRVKRAELRATGVSQLAAAPPPNPVADAAGQARKAPVPAPPEVALWLGGSPRCAGPPTPPAARAPDDAPEKSRCTADDVFVRSCQLLESGQAPLSDPYYLKSLSRDTVDFLLRLSASSLGAHDYADQGFTKLGDFVHAALEQLTGKNATVGDLAAPTLTLASEISVGLALEELGKVGAAPQTKALEATILPLAKAWISDGCPYLPDPNDAKAEPKLACKEPKGGEGGGGKNDAKHPSHWFVEAPPTGCAEFLATTDERTTTFKSELFAQGTPALVASEDPCLDTWPDRGKRLCARARLTMNLHDALTRVQCQAALPDAARRSALRELIFVLLEQKAYRSALTSLKSEAPGGVEALDDFLKEARKIDVDKLPREELAYGIRVLGAYLAAVRDEPDRAAAWMAFLVADVRAFRDQAGAPNVKPETVVKAYQKLLHGPALASDRRPGSPPTAELRDAVKDFIVLPALVIAREADLADNVWGTMVALSSVVDALQARRDGPPNRLNATLRAFAQLAATLSGLSTTLAQNAAASAAAGGAPRTNTELLVQVSAALTEASTALLLAADRDWVGLGVRAFEQLETRMPDAKEEVRSSFRFVRVLLSMYQAQSVDEAKAIFQATLEDTGSRTRRYDLRAWDVGALLGVRAGGQLGRTVADGKATYDRAGLYGLYAPFGVLGTRGGTGWMFYPIDLGAYLTATPNSKEETTTRWQDAIRGGVVLFHRWKDVPGAVGIGADWRPPIASRTEGRLFLTGALELPLYLIH